jgi:hypothetical protein
MVSAILAKIAAGTAGLAFTALGARLALKLANKMNWEPIFAAVEAAGVTASRIGNAKFNAPFWEPIETFLQEKVDVIWFRFKKGLDTDEKQEEAPK